MGRNEQPDEIRALYSESMSKYQAAYAKKNYGRIELRIPKEKKAEWQKRADEEGISLTEFIVRKVDGGAE